MCGKKMLDTKNYKQTSVWHCRSEEENKSQPAWSYFQYVPPSCLVSLADTIQPVMNICVFSLLFSNTYYYYHNFYEDESVVS